MKCDLEKADDPLRPEPGVPTKHESVCVPQLRLQAKDVSLQEALKEVAKLKAAITETQKRCHSAEEKAQKKRQELKMAKMVIINNNAQIEKLERRNSQLEMTLSDTMEKLDKKHKDLVDSKAIYTIDYEEGMKLLNIHRKLGDDLFYHMTHLEVIVANEMGLFFFGENDMLLKARAANYLPLSENSKTMQEELLKASKEENANDDLPKGEETAYGEFRLAIQAPPTIDKTAESSSFLTAGMDHFTHSTMQETRVFEDCGSLEPTTPGVSRSEPKALSDEEISPQSLRTLYNCEEEHPDSVTSNDSESESSACESSGGNAVDGLKLEGPSTTEDRGLDWLLGYNPSPEESFLPQYQQGGSMNESSQEQVNHEVLSEGSPETEGPGVQWLLGYNAHPEEPFYPQYAEHDEEKDTDSTKMTTSPKNDTLIPVTGSESGLVEPVDSQDHQSTSEAKESPISTCDEPAAGPKLAWLLGYNPEPEEAFYPQYSQQRDDQGDTTSPASIKQDQEQKDATVTDTAHIFEVKPENHGTATTTTESTPLTVDVSFADRSKDFKEEVMVQTEPETGDTASTASTELEQQETSSKSREASPIFTTQAVEPPTASTTSPTESPSIDISFGNTSEPFKAGAKVRMTRAQRREAAMKAQAEAMASKKKMEGHVEEEGGKFGRKESRQERRAADRKASKAGAKQLKRNVWRL